MTGTLVAPDIERTVDAYCRHLHTSEIERGTVSEAQARLWGKPRLAGLTLVTLASPSNHPWLRVIDCPGSLPARPLLELGWLALEVLVQDVASLAADLADSPFEIVREPGEPSGAAGVRVMQVVGPAGEVLYLTELASPMEPFNIDPAADNAGGNAEMSGLDPSVRHPVATVQLAGHSTVEINQLGVARARRPSPGMLPAGIAMVSFMLDNLDNIGVRPVSPPQNLDGGLYGGQRVAACRGAAGELLELIEASAVVRRPPPRRPARSVH